MRKKKKRQLRSEVRRERRGMKGHGMEGSLKE